MDSWLRRMPQRKHAASMDQLLYVAVAIGAGGINALQLAMLGGITRERSGFEATWISMLASLAGMALLMSVVTLVDEPPSLPAPFNHVWIYGVLLAIMTMSLLMSARGLPAYYVATGLTSIPYLLAAAFVGPRIGLGVYFAAIVTGQLTGSLFLDHVGAFGAEPRPVDAIRLAGVGVLLLGVLMIRGRQ
jgi:uncharacterized membrane protein YdcZ (DUF606 family)